MWKLEFFDFVGFEDLKEKIQELEVLSVVIFNVLILID